MMKRSFAVLLASASLLASIGVPGALAAGPDRGTTERLNAEGPAQAKMWQAWTERLNAEGPAQAKMWQAWTERLDGLTRLYLDRQAMSYRPPTERP